MAAAGGRISAGVGFNQLGQHAQERNQEATVYVGNLDPQVTEELVWELMVQVPARCCGGSCGVDGCCADDPLIYFGVS